MLCEKMYTCSVQLEAEVWFVENVVRFYQATQNQKP